VLCVPAHDCNSDRSSELVEHDWKCAAFAVVVDEWRDAKTVVPSCRFACQLSKDFVEVDIDFSEPTCAHGQDLSSIETAQHGLERAHHITRTVSDDLGRKLVVQFLGLENVCLADLLCTPIRR